MLMLPVGGLRKTGQIHSYELNCQRPTIPARWGIVSHPSPLPKEREPVTRHRPLVCCGGAHGLPGRCQKNPSLLRTLSVALAPHPSPLPKDKEPVTRHRPLVCCGGAHGLPGRCQKNPSL